MIKPLQSTGDAAAQRMGLDAMNALPIDRVLALMLEHLECRSDLSPDAWEKWADKNRRAAWERDRDEL